MTNSRPIKYRMDASETNRHPEYRTLCEVLREAARTNENPVLRGTFAQEHFIRELLEEAYDLAKRMDRKLKEYNKDWLRESDVCERIKG